MSAIPYILIFATLFPYLPYGLRVEHLLIPALATWSVFVAKRLYTETAVIVGGLMFGALAAAFTSQYSIDTGADVEPVSQFVRLILPAFGFMALTTVLPQRKSVAVEVSEATVVAGALVAAFTVLSLVSSYAQSILVFWVQADEGSVWQSAFDIGRYTGIFNQPIEAGIFYSLCLISAVHAYRYGKMNRIALLVATALIVFGGSASLSKNFIVLGAACAVGYAFFNRLISRSLLVILSIPIIAAAPIGLQRLNINYITSLSDLYSEQGLFGALSAGRFGSVGGSVSILFESLIESGDWVMGRGLGSHLPLDSGYLEFFYQGGILSLAGYVLAIGVLSLQGWRNRAHRDGQFLIVLMVYIWLSSAGGPTITASRTGIVLLILICACLVSIRQHSKKTRSITQGGSRLAY
jgi:hypothetical protein